MRIFLLLSLSVFQLGCATRVWVAERTPTSGVIAYENYEPRRDNGEKIKALIHCPDHMMTLNRIVHIPESAVGYTYSAGIIAPIGGGVREVGEYHYRCVDSKPITNSNPCYNTCDQDFRNGKLKITLFDCYKRLCD